MTISIFPAAPLVSVIVPCYESAACLEMCLERLSAQTLTNIEIIPVNDCSTDRSGIMMNIYAATDSRIKPIHRKRAGGFAHTVNHGIQEASGMYVAVMPPHIIPETHMLESMYTRAISACRDGADIVRANLACGVPKSEDSVLYAYDNIQDGTYDPADSPFLLTNSPHLYPALYKRDMLGPRGVLLAPTENSSLQETIFHTMTMLHARTLCYIDDALATHDGITDTAYKRTDDVEDMFALFAEAEEMLDRRHYRLASFILPLHALKARHIRAHYYRLHKDERPGFLRRIREELRDVSYSVFRDNPYIYAQDKDFVLRAAYGTKIRFALGYGLREKLRVKAFA